MKNKKISLTFLFLLFFTEQSFAEINLFRDIPKELRISVFKDDYTAQFSLGLLYYLDLDYPSAVSWWRRAVENAQKANKRAFMFRCSAFDLLVPDKGEAIMWMHMAAEEGIADAQFELALAYENGDNLRRDYKQAVNWYRKAAEQGHSDAQFVLEDLGELGIE